MWIAKFQLLVTQRRLELPRSLARRHGHDYYLGWSQRAADSVARAGPHDAQLEPIKEGFERSLDLLTEGDLVPIHGEFYPRNVLVHEGDIRPIDWESTAMAAGEIDLASLVERWPPDVVDACCAAYAHARWPAGPPSDSQSRLDMARIYLHFRWIAVRSTPRDSIQWRFEELRTIGARLGFLPSSERIGNRAAGDSSPGGYRAAAWRTAEQSRNHAIVRSSPSVSPTSGAQPRAVRATVMSGRRRTGSSTGRGT